MTEEVKELVKLSLNKPMRLSADPSSKRPPGLTEEYVNHYLSFPTNLFLNIRLPNLLSLNCRVVRIRRTREANQEAVLLSLCTRTFKEKVIIFRLDFTRKCDAFLVQVPYSAYKVCLFAFH